MGKRVQSAGWCEACATPGAETVLACTLVTTNLCVPCQTDLDLYLARHPLWSERLELDARKDHFRSLAIAQQPVGLDDWAVYHRDNHANWLALSEVVIAWIAQPTA